MKNYQHSLTITATPAAVYAALTTTKGLRGWWTPDCEGTMEVGGTIHFRFGTTHKDMRIERLEPGREVRWECTRAHIAADSIAHKDEWVGTQPVFRMSDVGQGRTRLDFEHIGLVPSLECYGLCYKGWEQFMGSLQQYLETGAGTPFGADSTPCHASTEKNAAMERSQPA
ncbi:MAG: SRPBCC domain-containing protein [Pseudomonadota bacterium]